MPEIDPTHKEYGSNRVVSINVDRIFAKIDNNKAGGFFASYLLPKPCVD